VNQLNPSLVDLRGLPPTTHMRELTSEEVNEVSGGVLPLVAVAAAIVLVAAAVEESLEESADPGDETGSSDD